MFSVKTYCTYMMKLIAGSRNFENEPKNQRQTQAFKLVYGVNVENSDCKYSCLRNQRQSLRKTFQRQATISASVYRIRRYENSYHTLHLLSVRAQAFRSRMDAST